MGIFQARRDYLEGRARAAQQDRVIEPKRERSFPHLALGTAVLIGGLALGGLTGGEHWDKADAHKARQHAAEAQVGYGVIDAGIGSFFKDKDNSTPDRPDHEYIAREAMKDRVTEDAKGVGTLVLNAAGLVTLAYGGFVAGTNLRAARRKRKAVEDALDAREYDDDYDLGPDDSGLGPYDDLFLDDEIDVGRRRGDDRRGRFDPDDPFSPVGGDLGRLDLDDGLFRDPLPPDLRGRRRAPDPVPDPAPGGIDDPGRYGFGPDHTLDPPATPPVPDPSPGRHRRSPDPYDYGSA